MFTAVEQSASSEIRSLQQRVALLQQDVNVAYRQKTEQVKLQL